MGAGDCKKLQHTTAHCNILHVNCNLCVGRERQDMCVFVIKLKGKAGHVCVGRERQDMNLFVIKLKGKAGHESVHVLP